MCIESIIYTLLCGLDTQHPMQGLNSRLVPVTGDAMLAILSALFFNTVPAGGGFIATPVNSSSMLCTWRVSV